MSWKLITLLGLLSTTIACKEDVDSTDVRTHGVYAVFEAVANGNGTAVKAELKVGGDDSNTYLDLDGSDVLKATVGEQTKQLTGSGTTYRGSFSEDAAGTDIEIAFTRGDLDDDAPSSTATLPAPFDLGGVDKADEISRADNLKFTWDPSGSNDDMEWELDGDCIYSESGTVTDTGSHTVRAGTLDATGSDDEEESCTVTLTVDRVRRGKVDKNFGEGGQFRAIQRRRVAFTSTPE